MKNLDLSDEVIVITGALGLLGSKFVDDCIDCNGRVIALDIHDESKIKSRIEKYDSSKFLYQKCDITNELEIRNALEEGKKAFDKITALINSAYPRNKNYGRKFEDITYQDFSENLNLHLGGFFLVIKEVVKYFKENRYGNIINLGSIYGFKAPRFEIYNGTSMTMPFEYSAIKGGIINMSRYLASYLGPFNIKVNTISPGGVFDNQNEEFVKKYNSYVLLGNKMASTDDITGTVLFLLSNHSSYITGQNIVVDGGWTV